MKPLFVLLSAISFILGMATLLSCQDSLFYSEYKAIPYDQWDSRDTLYFQLPEAERSFDATLTISVRTRKNYGYKTIALRVEHLLNGTLVNTDTLHITLYDDNGQPLGRAFPVSDNYSRPLPLHISKNGHHTLRITHAMRLNPLENIPNVGVFIDRSNQNGMNL